MSDFYTNHLLKRYLSGDILAQEKITLKALLEPCILKNTADEQQRIVFSQLVRPSPAPSSCLQPSPVPSRRAPVRACNQPFLTLFVVPIGKTYNILSNDSKPNQPKTAHHLLQAVKTFSRPTMDNAIPSSGLHLAGPAQFFRCRTR